MGQLEIRNPAYGCICSGEVVVHLRVWVFVDECEIEVEFEVFGCTTFVFGDNQSICMIVYMWGYLSQ